MIQEEGNEMILVTDHGYMSVLPLIYARVSNQSLRGSSFLSFSNSMHVSR